jgi:hypothetical protein
MVTTHRVRNVILVPNPIRIARDASSVRRARSALPKTSARSAMLAKLKTLTERHANPVLLASTLSTASFARATWAGTNTEASASTILRNQLCAKRQPSNPHSRHRNQAAIVVEDV